MSDFVLSPAARQDLFDIWDYIARDNIDVADRVLEEINQEMAGLARTPGKGHFRKDLADEPLKFWRIYTYLIIFRPETIPLEIVRVLSGYRDVRSKLRGE